MKIEIIVSAEVSFSSGKYASREDITQALIDDISDPGTVTANEGEYNVDSFEVSEHSTVDPRTVDRRRRLLIAAIETLDAAEKGIGKHKRPDAMTKLVADLRREFDVPGTESAPGVSG